VELKGRGQKARIQGRKRSAHNLGSPNVFGKSTAAGGARGGARSRFTHGRYPCRKPVFNYKITKKFADARGRQRSTKSSKKGRWVGGKNASCGEDRDSPDMGTKSSRGTTAKKRGGGPRRQKGGKEDKARGRDRLGWGMGLIDGRRRTPQMSRSPHRSPHGGARRGQRRGPLDRAEHRRG